MPKQPHILIFSLLFPSLAHALNEDIEQVVVTGSYSASKENTVANSITVLNSKRISQLGKNNLVDVLRSVSGLTVRQLGGAGGVNELYIRGGESNFTLVMIDGVKVNDSTNTRGGGFNFNSLNLESIERVEILRGTQSAVYGGDALAGVINIISKKPDTHRNQQRAFFELGQASAFSAGYGVSAASDTISAKLDISTTDRGELVDGSLYENNQVFTGLSWQPNEDSLFEWKLRFLDDERYSYPEQSGGDIYAQSDVLELNSSQELSQNFSWQQRFHRHWQSRVDINLFNRDSVMDSPGIPPYNAVPPHNADTKYKNNEIKWVNTLGVEQLFWLNTGFVLQREDGTSTGSIANTVDTPFSLNRENQAAFIEVNYAKEGVFSTRLSARYDNPEELSSETSINFGLQVPISSNLDASFNWGDGFKLPSFFALGHPLVGNPELKPERARNSELRLSYQHENLGRLSVTWFDNHLSDLVDFDSELLTNVNRAVVDITGLEADWEFNSSKNTSFRLFATFMNINTHEEEVVLSGRPEQQAGINFNWQLSEAKSANFDFRHVGEQFDTSLYSGTSVREVLPSYNIVDVNFNLELTENINLLIAVNNLLNETYFEAIGFSSPGRNAFIKTGINF